MADSSKRPVEHTPNRSPSIPTPLGALSPLPEVLLAHLCSFPSGRDLARLGGACAALHESPVSFWPRLRVGLRKDWWRTEGENKEERLQRCVEALRMLARRAASGLKELRLGRDKVSETFLTAVREGGRPMRLLSSLRVVLDFHGVSRGQPTRDVLGTRVKQLVTEMLDAEQLPILRELHVSMYGAEKMLPVLQPLGQGACPRLERIKIDPYGSQQLSELSEAMRARPEGCEELRAVCLGLPSSEGEEQGQEQAICEALQALLSRLSPNSLEELCLTFLSAESLKVAVVPLLTSSWPALKTLNLTFTRAPSVDGLLHALARGAMPSLTCLDLTNGTCSDEAWRALGETMGPEGTCLRWIKTLRLCGVIRGPRQLEILCRAVGSGHGCPELESLNMYGKTRRGEEAWGAALAPAFRPPRGLPRLKELHLDFVDLTGLDQLVEALQHRPHASQPLEMIRMDDCHMPCASGLGRAMEEGRSLASLRELIIRSSWERAEQSPMQLVEALAGGAGQQLEKIECIAEELPVEVVNRLLQGLAMRGACPRLRSLVLVNADGAVGQGGWLDVSSLGTILAGRAACSHTLRGIQLDTVGASSEGVRRLAACLREPQAIQLESLGLCAGEPDACEAVMELLSALGGRAGDGLQYIDVELSGCKEGEAMRVVGHLVGIIKAGGLPTSRGCQINILDSEEGTVCVGRDAVEHALRERVQAQWLASW